MSSNKTKKKRKELSGQKHRPETTSIVIKLKNNKLRLPSFIKYYHLILLIISFFVIVLYPYNPSVSNVNLPEKGTVADETIIAPFTFKVRKSDEELRKEKQAAEKKVPSVFVQRPGTAERTLQGFKKIIADFEKLEKEDCPEDIKTRIREEFSSRFSEEAFEYLRNNREVLQVIIEKTREIMETGVLDRPVVSDRAELRQYRENYGKAFSNALIDKNDYVIIKTDTSESTEEIENLYIKEEAVDSVAAALKNKEFDIDDNSGMIYDILDYYIEPNYIYDKEETYHRKDRAAAGVDEFKGRVLKNTEIVRKHQIVSESALEKQRSLYEVIHKEENKKKTVSILLNNAGRVLLVILMLYMVLFYVDTRERKFFSDRKKGVALLSAIVLQLALIRFLLLVINEVSGSVVPGDSKIIHEYLIPGAVASMLISMLFSLRLSIVVNFFIAAYLSISLSFDSTIMFYAITGGSCAAYLARGIRYRWDFLKAIIPISLSYALVILIKHLIDYTLDPFDIFLNVSLAFGSTLLSVLFVMILTPVFENTFGITTDMTLIELSDMNNPLLKRFSIEAAGSYNHSIMVANLAESAAERINANPLLARVASYYHDVGKLKSPGKFIENQRGVKNVHDKMNPNMSAMIISSHVKHGVELARKHNLPPVLISAIQQHHGNSQISFFLQKAKESGEQRHIDEENFRYPGPKPQTRENAVIMLADSVEAASRTLSSISKGELRAMVQKIIYDKFSSLQLEECDLTFADLSKIIEGFMPVLEGIFHTRVEYPKNSGGMYNGKG